jgi:hypothetical protein
LDYLRGGGEAPLEVLGERHCESGWLSALQVWTDLSRGSRELVIRPAETKETRVEGHRLQLSGGGGCWVGREGGEDHVSLASQDALIYPNLEHGLSLFVPLIA